MCPVDRPIYLDNHATTPVDPRVLEAMLPTFTVMFGNAASRQHAHGWEAEELVTIAREQVAALIGAETEEIVFTSGATESNNLAIRGVAIAHALRGRHIITAATEHPAVLDPCERLKREGWDVTVLPVDGEGMIDLGALERAITPETTLISLMAANSEIGILHPLREIGALARERGVLFHTDAAQAAGKIALDVNADHIDLLSISAHKMCGPKGVGALYVRRRNPRVRLEPLLEGGGHENGVRSGTLNVPGIVGLGKAAAIAREEMREEAQTLAALRDRLLERIRAGLSGVEVNGALERRLPGNLNLSFEGVDGDSLITAMPGLAVSTGSACVSAKQEPSHVLRALGIGDERVRSSLRFGIGRFNTLEEIDLAAEMVIEAVTRLREMSPRLE
ncbi:IscS subfamily cysteine desulfurase [Candidatus Sumerlaeota bacterium]|nr:IscS subfamily cysteine desulfurase [Candidatus Sumerlaeota bacterium]